MRRLVQLIAVSVNGWLAGEVGGWGALGSPSTRTLQVGDHEKIQLTITPHR